MFNKLHLCSLPIALLFGSGLLHAAATIVIQNADDPGVGFNDPTPVVPVGGNNGHTLGAQRLLAFEAAANKWGATVTSTSTITIYAFWDALPCTSTGAVLGSAGAYTIWSDFVGAPHANAWFSAAEANSLFGADLDPTTPEIIAAFNVNLGQMGCLEGSAFYLGLDNNHGSDIDLVTVLTHEFGHGLGFQTFTDGSTGQQIQNTPSIWDYFLFDKTQNKTWASMTDAQRVTSSLNSRKLVWTGSHVKAAVPVVLLDGTPDLTVSAPSSVTGVYQVGTAGFGPVLNSTGITAEVMPIIDTAPNLGLACNPLSAANVASVANKIALVDRGTCNFTTKVKNLQNAGARAVIIADNAAGSPPAGLGGSDSTIVIPAVRISQADGVALKAATTTRSRLHSGLFAKLGLDLSRRAGADEQSRALLYNPNPYEPGSSISHWDTIATPNLLMEPAINGDLTHEVTPPHDLTFPLLQDIGWQ